MQLVRCFSPESKVCLQHLEEILDAVDGAMVARGDLGAELPVEKVLLPCIQNQHTCAHLSVMPPYTMSCCLPTWAWQPACHTAADGRVRSTTQVACSWTISVPVDAHRVHCC